MCGIAGIVERAGADAAGAGQDPLPRMLATLAHRGPDGAGVVHRGTCRLGLRRLAIIDVEADAEPFASEDGRVVACCNGEIYNAPDLRRELEARGHRFRTSVDTEVLVHLWEEHGPELVHRLNGMFACAIWDDRRGSLFLARDRAGQKPLFYHLAGGRLLFASELRALLAHPAVTPRLDPVALARFLAHGYVPAPQSPLAGIRKLPAAHYLLAKEEGVELVRYWDLADWFPEPASIDPRSGDEIAEELVDRLRLAVTRRARSDVPLGLFLSGGIDSATILSFLAEARGTGAQAFAIGHGDAAFDESGFAAETARAFGADLHTLILERPDLEEGLRHVGAEMDEPLGDASAIPTYLLSRFARRRVKVVLTGEGGDELFAGYPTYLGHRLADGLERLPRLLRRGLVAAARRSVPVSMGNVGLDYLLQRFAAGLDRPLAERHHAWFGCLPPERVAALLAPRIAATLNGDRGPAPFVTARARRPFANRLDRLLYTDFVLYLQDDLLTKVDRTSMLASLEARSPFLDHELAQFAAGVPARWKLRGWTTKAILRHATRDRLPAAVLERRKRGFNIPFSRWVLAGLGEALRDRFSRERVAARGLLSHDAVHALLDEHLSRRADHRKPLYALLALDLWVDRTFGEATPVPVDEGEWQ